ncbi:uncharacterized protein LOC105688076 [Athalia rosae]|uniref:uncharacterized protein LOC105688076 n=1 Tax=Athalia rosae TaxID=37344 RepID=UPI002033A587|nr:uncharacterized protein LOC105688076 [Athalia rosae]
MSDGRGRVICASGAGGFQWYFHVNLLVFVIIFNFLNLPNYAQCASTSPDNQPVKICAMDGCNCTVLAHRWTNVKCVFAADQEVELGEGSVPADAIEVEVSNCRELRIQAGAFTGGIQLRRVHVSGVNNVVAKGQAFHNVSAPNPMFEVSECESVVLESHAFKNSLGPMSVSIARCKHVRIKPNVFLKLLKFTIKDVPKLTISSNAFKFEPLAHERHGAATQIFFQSVNIQELPTMAFPSTAMEVRMDNLEATVIRKDAFSATNILKVAISNATIGTIETGAFNGRTLIDNLEFVDVSVGRIKSAALVAPVTNFTIQYSRVNEMETDAINAVAATVTLNNNEFQNIARNAITLDKWSHIAIHQNLFHSIENDSISVRIIENSATVNEFIFTENHIINALPGSLRFATQFQSSGGSRIGGNYFAEKCNCNLDGWMKKLSGDNASVDILMSSSLCEIDETLEKCFKVPLGRLGMRNFTSVICGEGKPHIVCEKPASKPEPSVSPPSVGPHVYPRQKGYFDVEMSDSEQLEREKRIILIICASAALCVMLVILMFGVFYVRRRGACPKLTSGPFSGLASWMSPTNGMTAATSARSISRMSVNEYAGLRTETRVLDLEVPPDDDTNIAEDGLYAYTENKATQTLPEELTEEYLKDLRDRLDDPDNYSEARDMIEHLYDLIKVEESCNNNNNNRIGGSDAQGVYHDVVVRPRGRGGVPRPSASVGTRVPSLDKLLPSPVGPRSQIVEYSEPRDSKASDQNHLYAELLGDETVPSTSRLSQPVLATLAGRAQHPLPPEVSNAVDDGKTIDGVQKSAGGQGARRGSNGDQGKSQTRPLSFLKALGESILGSSASKNQQKRPNAPLLCEYAEPSDAASHLYSELSEPQTHTASRPPSKMANRPLPTKPGDHNETTPINNA